MAQNKKPNKRKDIPENVVIFDVPGGYVVSGNFRVELHKGEEDFGEFVERFDSYWNSLRNKTLRRIANHLHVDVRFEE